jgi:Tfp pilus assembly protein PilF
VLAARHQTGPAIAAFREAVSLNPRSSAAQAQLARLYFQEGNVATSVQFAQDAVKNAPQNVEARLILARALTAQGDTARAERELTPLLAAQPKSAAVLNGMGTLMLAKRDTASARTYFTRALAVDAKSADAIAGLVALDIAAKNTTAARARVDAALAASPADPALLLVASRTHAAAGDPARTEQLLRQAIAVSPTSLEAYEMLGALYISQKRLDEARAEFDALAERQRQSTGAAPAAVAAATMSAIILQTQGQTTLAKERYEAILQQDPSAAVAANNLAWILAETDESIDRALQYARSAKASLPQRAEVSDTLGWIYFKKGLWPQAVTALRESAGREPGNPVFLYHLGAAYAKTGENDKARVTLEQALKLGANFDGAVDARRILDSLPG